jgi:hypothetical protein
MTDIKNEISTGEVDGLPISDVQSLSVFIKTNFPRCIPIPLVEGTKTPWKGFEYKDENVTDEYLWQKWNNVGSSLVENGDADVALCLRDDIIVVDVDNREHADYFMNVDCFKSTVSVRTQKGAHFYFKKTPECAHWKTKTRPFEVNGVKQDIDIKSNYDNGTGSLITIPPSTDKEWINPFGRYEVQPMPSTFVEWSNGAMDEVPRPKIVRVIKNDVKFDRLETAVMGLSTERATDYENWTRVCWAIYNVACENGFEEQGEDLIHEFSKKCPMKYNRRKVDRFIRYSSYCEKGYTMGTIMAMLKKDNPEVFKSLAPITNQPFKGYAFVEDDDDPIDIFDGEAREYEDVKREFEKTMFKVKYPICYCEMTESADVVIKNEDKMRKTYRNLWCLMHTTQFNPKTKKMEVVEDRVKFIDKWMNDPKIRTYDSMDMYPPPLKCPPKVYNLWTGYAVERLTCESSGNVTPFIKHIDILANHDEKVREFIILWLAHMFQRPGELNGIALVFRSNPRAGKNIFWNVLMRLLMGADKFKETAMASRELFGQFSVGRFRKVLINIDEMGGKEGAALSEVLKNAITSMKYNHEIKGIDPMETNNFNRFVFTVNKDLSVKVDFGDGRYVVVSVSNEMIGNKDYFMSFIEYMNDPTNLKAIHEYLMAQDISQVNWQNDRPVTSLYEDMKTLNIDLVSQFVINFTQRRLDEGFSEEVERSATQWYAMFATWCKNNRHSTRVGDVDVVSMKERMFWIRLSRIVDDRESGMTKRKSNGNVLYDVNPTKLKAYYEKLGIYDLEYNFSSSEFIHAWRGV